MEFLPSGDGYRNQISAEKINFGELKPKGKLILSLEMKFEGDGILPILAVENEQEFVPADRGLETKGVRLPLDHCFDTTFFPERAAAIPLEQFLGDNDERNQNIILAFEDFLAPFVSKLVFDWDEFQREVKFYLTFDFSRTTRHRVMTRETMSGTSSAESLNRYFEFPKDEEE